MKPTSKKIKSSIIIKQILKVESEKNNNKKDKNK
jgi:hypothetical protein